jgi:hypothetical protein
MENQQLFGSSNSSVVSAVTYSIRHITFSMLYCPHDRIYHKLLVSRRYVKKSLKAVRVYSLNEENEDAPEYNIAGTAVQALCSTTYPNKLKKANSVLGKVFKIHCNHLQSTFKDRIHDTRNIAEDVAL